MVAAIAVIGAISGCVSTINTIKSWIESLERFVRDYKETGELLLRLKIDIQACEFRLDLWREFWDLNNASGRYMRELWGSTGTDTIVSQLTTVESLCNKFDEALDFFFGNTSLVEQIYQAVGDDALGSTSSRLDVFQVYAKTIRSETRTRQIISFVRTLHSRAREWLSQVDQHLAKLETDALRAYNIRHGMDTKACLTQEQRDMVHVGVLTQMTMEYREFSEELFNTCFPMQTAANIPAPRADAPSTQRLLKLKVDLMPHSNELELSRALSAQDIAEKYHLLLNQDWRPRGTPETEICILRSVSTAPHIQISPSVLTAYQTALRLNRPAHARSNGSLFCFRPPLEEERLAREGGHAVPLKQLLEAPYSDTFLLQDRIHLAYKIIECGALLTGTSWLSSLKTRHLVRSRSKAGFYYTLDIHPPTTMISDDSLNTHIMFIGKILIEIGTGMLFKDILCRGQEMMFVLEGLQTRAPYNRVSTLYTAEEVRNILVRNNLGSWYTSAALHCFGLEIRRKCNQLMKSQGDEARMASKKKVLKDYFLNIYSPYVSLFLNFE